MPGNKQLGIEAKHVDMIKYGINAINNMPKKERVLADREAFAAESSSVLSKITIDPPYKIAIRETASGNSTRYFADLSVTNSSPYPIRSGVIAFKFDGGKYTHDLIDAARK